MQLSTNGCYALYLLSIPSHCTMGGTGRTRVIPKCPICYALYLLSIPSHCTMGGIGIIQTVPFATTCPYCPSHPGKEWTDWNRAKMSPLLCPVPTVHPIPLYQIKIYRGSMPETPLVFHTLCPQIHTCPPIIHPISFCPPLGKKLKETLKDK